MRRKTSPFWIALFLPTLAACNAQEDATAPRLESQALLAKGGGGGPPSPKCRVGFALELDESFQIRSDRAAPDNVYSDKDEGVMVATDGTGLRFDTSTGGLESPADLRRVRLDFTGTGFEYLADPADPRGIDLRFDYRDFPLNLCAMAVGDVVSEPAELSFQNVATSQTTRLAWGWNPGALNGPLECDNLPPVGARRLTITKTSTNTWDVAGGSVCVYVGGGTPLAGIIDMPMRFTLTQLP